MVRASKRKSMGPVKYIRFGIAISISMIFVHMIGQIETGDVFSGLYAIAAVPFVMMIVYIGIEDALGELR